MIRSKIKTRDELVPICETLRSNGKSVGFTSGAFDLLHAGHSDYLEKAKALCDACTAGFVDARTATEFAAGHVTDAVHLPPAGHPGEAAAIAALRAFGRVVVYDGDYRCALADEVAARLRREGLPDVRVLEGAWPAWVAAGGSGESGFCPACHDEAAR